MATFTELTEFAPAARLDKESVKRQAKRIIKTPLLSRHLDIIPDTILILNEQRQIVFANKSATSTLGVSKREDLYGLRPGEALNCTHANESEHGCGTTSFCRNCGAIKSILSALKENQAVQECHITTNGGSLPFDFRITTSPYFFADELFVVFVIVDISNEKRREVLERIFFHDVNNTLNVLLSTVEIMPPHTTPKENELAQEISTSVHMLVNEIGAQQSLLLAEDGNLALNPEELHSLKLLTKITSVYRHHACAQGRNILIDVHAVDTAFICDKTHLSRVIGNMLKNALEASSPGESITAGCELNKNGQIRFWVQNSQYISQSVRNQIFNRSFSTKGKGRGIGTYSMKILGERYLKGSVGFTSTPDEGTTFSITLNEIKKEAINDNI